MNPKLEAITAAREELAAAEAAREDAQAKFDRAVVDAMANRIVGQTTANDVAEAAGWSPSRLYQFLRSARAA